MEDFIMISGLGERLQEQRTNKGLSQKEVASIIDVAPSVISNYESNSRIPSVDKLMALARLYRCSTDYLLGLDKNRLPTADTSMLTDNQNKLLQQFLTSLN